MKTYNVEYEDNIDVIVAASFEIVNGVLIFYSQPPKQAIAAVNGNWKRIWEVHPTEA